MRSLLFVPGDAPEKLQKAFRSGADALILDLEDSVALDAKEQARRTVLAFLQEHRGIAERPRLYVRINPLASPLSEGDLDVVMVGAPDGIVLPKSESGAEVTLLDARLSVREALHRIADGTTRVLPIVTETGRAVFGLGSYRGSSARLAGLTWGAEDLSAETGAQQSRNDGEWTAPFQTVRSLVLFAAAAAGVAAIDTVHTDFHDLEGLARDCETALRDGFSGKLAIHPDQVPLINDAFTPSIEAIVRAEAVVTAFAEAGDAGVIALDGKMLDRPHLKAAERLLDRAGRMPAPDPAAEPAQPEAIEAPAEPASALEFRRRSPVGGAGRTANRI